MPQVSGTPSVPALGGDVRRTTTTASATIIGRSRTIIRGRVMKIIGTPASASKTTGVTGRTEFTPSSWASRALRSSYFFCPMASEMWGLGTAPAPAWRNIAIALNDREVKTSYTPSPIDRNVAVQARPAHGLALSSYQETTPT